MLTALRFALLCLIALLLVSVVIGVFTAETGTAEKIALTAFAALLVYASSYVRRLGDRPQTVSGRPRVGERRQDHQTGA